MGDQAAYGAAMTAARQGRHAEWKRDNRAALDKSGLAFTVTNHGENLCFREHGKPMVDFYPSTGRWRTVGARRSKTYRGGAAAFFAWYAKQGQATL
jgi:hypothetical protein